MAAANSSLPGSLETNEPGFPKEILGTKLEGKYLCSHCKNILRRPFQAQCGHRYCSYCLKSIISSGPQKCAPCLQEGLYEEGISVLENSSAFPDNAARREVESLPAICPNNGCMWKGTIKDYEGTHEESCPYMLIPCPSCKTMIKLNDTEHHNERECPERKLNCKFCKGAFYFPEIKAHDEVCPKFPLTCEGCGRKKIPREKFQDHVKSCGKCKAPCKFYVIGCTAMVRQLERSIGLKDLAIAEMEQRMCEVESTTYDGVFIWKIPDFTRKRQDAIVGRCPAMFSPAFYTSKYGYKLCLRIYLNGDGTGRGTHLSLFFVVIKGPNDALLRWPFNQKVTLMLLDQNNREHIIDAFRPDVTSSSFQRPLNDMNIASGCPLFCPITKLESKNSYVRDDTLFIKAIVDLTGL
ncbi:TNF receptor-associated factor 2 isoform X4 [Rhinatrema bivittatum]|uniref:TNF receptor-associated factor 2 isoform X4 n=1 Tax=Rhinatrema bivittatum TaxID=194408 RepID=UPI00112CA166|nr:TNF receptor-associated factor 2 isoform X4 [Rhinatrema bivittatum]